MDHQIHGLPYIIIEFQPGTFQPINEGEFNVCEGAEVTLTQGHAEVYDTPIWLRCYPQFFPPEESADPCVIDADTDYYVVTKSGIYDYYACVTYCSDYFCYINGGWTKFNFGNWSFCPSLSVKDTETKNTLPLYPNPSIQFLYFGMTDTLFKTIEVYDILRVKKFWKWTILKVQVHLTYPICLVALILLKPLMKKVKF